MNGSSDIKVDLNGKMSKLDRLFETRNHFPIINTENKIDKCVKNIMEVINCGIKYRRK